MDPPGEVQDNTMYTGDYNVQYKGVPLVIYTYPATKDNVVEPLDGVDDEEQEMLLSSSSKHSSICNRRHNSPSPTRSSTATKQRRRRRKNGGGAIMVLAKRLHPLPRTTNK